MKSVVSLLVILFVGKAAWALNAPTNVAGTALSSTSVKVTWTDNTTNESGFVIYRSTSSSSGFAKVGSVGTGMRAFTDKSAKAGTTYYYNARTFVKSSSGVNTYSAYSAVSRGVKTPGTSYTYNWSSGSWSACSATACGTNGTQTRSVVCKRNDGASVADSYCTTAKPATSQACSAVACPVYTYSWEVGSWSACSVTACGQQGTQSRSVVCKRNDGASVIDGFCTSAKPAASQPCVTAPCPTDPGVPVGAINVKTYGATPDDNTDDTVAIQRAVNATPSGGTVFVPAGKYMVNGVATSTSSGYFIKLKSNIHFMMDRLAVLQIIPNSAIRYYGIATNGASNVEISGGTVIGDRDQHTYTAGSTHEWGMCVGVTGGGTNIKIHDITVKDCTGDGIVTGGQANGITIQRVLSTNNRRQGLSLTNSYNVVVRDSEFSYTNGTSPMAGIDVEPDKYRTARNILIENNKIHHNARIGVIGWLRTDGLTIRGNDISYNTYGIQAVGSTNGVIEGNYIHHNKYAGVDLYSIGAETASNGVVWPNQTINWTISDNTFRNNSVSSVGTTSPTSPYTTITGVNTSTRTHIRLDQNGNGIFDIKVLTNDFAR